MSSVLAPGLSRQRFPIGETRETQLGVFSPQAYQQFPHYHKLPHDDPLALLKWKLYVRKRCLHDLEFRAWIDQCCEEDAAFFIATFGWVVEPRGKQSRTLPFMPWPDQIDIIAWWEECFGERNMALVKTRGIGASVMLTWYHLWKWLYSPEASIAALSKDEDTLEAPTPQSMLGRFVWCFNQLPAWKRQTPEGSIMVRDRKYRIYRNRTNDAMLQGFMSTGQKLRGNRFTSLWADEFDFFPPHVQQEWMTAAGGTTDSMLFCSTWNDFSGLFHHLCYEEPSSLLVCSAFWQNNVERYKGAYRMKYGMPQLVDKTYKHEPDYVFGEPDIVEEGILRSPWVDAELSKPNTDSLKALRDIYGMEICEQENNFFPRQVRDAVEASVSDPCCEGVIASADPIKGEVAITPTHNSEIRIWCDVPNVDRGPYTMGCDLSQGVGKAYSAAVVLDARGHQVLEYGVRDLSEPDFAANCVAIARWLCGDHGDGWCTIDFENNGQQGKPFSGELLRLNYGAIANSEVKGRKKNKFGEIPTYLGSTNRDGGYANLKETSRALLSMECVIKSIQIKKEMRLFSKDPDKNNQPRFPRNNKLGHGDFTQALGITWFRARSSVKPDAQVGEDGEPKQETTFEPRTKQLWSSRWR